MTQSRSRMCLLRIILAVLLPLNCILPVQQSDAADVGKSRLTIQEEDGSPTGRPKTLKVSNTTLTDNGDGTFSLTTGAGAGSGSMTTVKENDVQVGDADIVTLDFSGTNFNTAESPDTEIQITIADDGHNHTTATVTNFDASTTALIEGYGYTTNADVSITTGQVSDFDSASTALIEGYGYVTSADDGFPTGYIYNLQANCSSDTTVTVSAGSARDDGDAFDMVLTTDKSADITVTGIGGLEASDSEGASKWYEIYVMSKADGTTGILLNEAGTAIGTTPTDYAYKRLVGYMRNDSASNLLQFNTVGNSNYIETQYNENALADLVILSLGTATSYANVDASPFVCPASRFLLGTFSIVASGTNVTSVDVRSNGMSVPQFRMQGCYGSYGYTATYKCEVDSSQIFQYQIAAGGTHTRYCVYARGFCLNR